MQTKGTLAERRYAKYVFLDVVKFSQRAAEQQSAIVQGLNSLVKEILQEFHIDLGEEKETCIISPTGDGMAIALINQVQRYDIHIQIAIKLICRLFEIDAQADSPIPKFDVRIGINQATDILVTDINGNKMLAGSGINLASRVMDAADEGQILVSRAVYDELYSSEVYTNKFRRHTPTGKHNQIFEVYQYRDLELDGLNCDYPKALAPKVEPEKTLPEETAHYFVQAIIHQSELLSIKREAVYFSANTAVVLLYFLAKDSYSLSKQTAFDGTFSPCTKGAGKMTLQEQYKYYSSQDYAVTKQAVSSIVEGFLSEGGLELYSFEKCFQVVDLAPHYEFINEYGRQKLREDWINIWQEFELDKYV
jgi:class 3 adenylate cyclase